MRLSSRFKLMSAFCLLLAIATSLTLFGSTRGTSHASSTSKIIFSDCPNEGSCTANTDIDLINPDGTNVTKIGSGYDPELSPDGTMVVYAVVTATNCVTDPGFLSSADIYTMNSDGSNVHDIAPPQGCSQLTSPAWSPDGKKIAFTRLSDQIGYAVYIMNADGSNATELVANGAANPSWSPDGTKIIYTDESSNFLHIINADGTNDQNLGVENGAAASDIGATWSPDGTEIAYIGNGNNGCSSYCIQEVKPDGTGQATLYTSPFGSDIWDESWSPDGSQLALCMYIPNPYGRNNLYTISSTSTVPPSPGPSPTVSPTPLPSPTPSPTPMPSPTVSPTPMPTSVTPIFASATQIYNSTGGGCHIVSWGQLAPVTQAPPTVGAIAVSANPVEVNVSTIASDSFTYTNPTATNTATWAWGDGNTTAGTVTESNGLGSVSDSHTYTAAGVYTITLIVTGDNGLSSTSTYQYVSVYSPTAQGLFSAGEKYTSPTGAYPQNPSLTGDVHFGLSYKYQGTVPTSDKEFAMNFKSARFTFNATTVSSLVISNNVATLRGTGTINGSGTYNFLITGDGNANTIRIKITDPANNNNVIYDTQPGAADTSEPTTSVAGNVIVH